MALVWLALAGGVAQAAPCEMPSSDDSAIQALCAVQEGMARFEIGGGWGFLDKSGKLAGEPRFDDARDFSEGLAAVKLEGLWGFVDKTGELVIPPRFSYVQDFSGGSAAAMGEDDAWGYIGRHGQWVIAPAYEQAGPFRGETAVVSERGQGYLLIDRQGQVVKRFEAGLEVDLFPDARGLYRAKREGASWIWRRDEGLLPVPQAMRAFYDEGEDLFPAAQPGQSGADALWGAVDIQGRWVVPARFAAIGAFQDGLAIAQAAAPAHAGADGSSQSRPSVGLIDRHGRFVLPPKYEQITRDTWGGFQASYAEEGGSDIIGQDGRVLLSAATCPRLQAVQVQFPVGPMQWHVVAGCDRSWAFHAAAGMVSSRIAMPAAYASGTHLLLVEKVSEDESAATDEDDKRAPLQFEIFDTAGQLVFSSEAPALQGDQALTGRYDRVFLMASGKAATATDGSRPELLPLALVVRGYSEIQVITRDGKLVSDPEWTYDSDVLDYRQPSSGGEGGEGPLVMYTMGGWGAIDGRGQWVVPPQYRRLSPFHDGAALAREGERLVVVEDDGKRHLLPEDVQGVRRASQGVFLGQAGHDDDGLVRLDLATGEITRITMAGVAELKDFHDGLASARAPDARRWGLLDDKGGWVVPPRFDNRLEPVLDTDGRLVGWRSEANFTDGETYGRLFGWLDPKGRELLAPGYSAIEYDDEHGMLRLTQDEKHKGLMAPDGQMLLAAQYEEIRPAGKMFTVVEPAQYGLLDARGEWSSPLATLVLSGEGDLPYEQTRSGAERVLVDIHGRRSTASAPLPLAIAHDDPSQWWWSRTENAYLDDEVTVFYGFDFKERMRLPGQVPWYSRFSEDVITFTPRNAREKNAVALADRFGNVLGQYPYKKIDAMSEGLAAFEQVAGRHPSERRNRARQGDDAEDPPIRMGFLDRRGKVAIPPVFEQVQAFSEGRAVVLRQGNIGLIDTRGKLVAHSAWLCGRVPVILDASGRVQWPAAAVKIRKCG